MVRACRTCARGDFAAFKQSQLSRRLRARWSSRLLRGRSSDARNHVRRSVLPEIARRTQMANPAGELTCLECLTASCISTCLLLRSIRPRGVLRRRILPVEGPMHEAVFSRIHLQQIVESGVHHYASEHNSPAHALRTTPIAALTTAPRRNVSRPLRHKVSSASSQAAAARRRGDEQ